MIHHAARFALLVSASLLASACLIVPPPQQGGSPATMGGSEPSTPQATPPMATPEAPAAPTAGPKPMAPSSIEVRNTCSKTVQLFIGEKPKFGSGTKTSIGSNTTTTFPRKPDGTAVVWIIDDKENGIQSANVGVDTKRVEIGSSCTDLTAK